jgi:RimJ/RimL family protein N-acetyltransferase
MHSFLKKIIIKLKALLNYKKTLAKCSQLVSINNFEVGNFILRGADIKDLGQLKIIYSQLNNVDLSRSNIDLLKKCPGRLILIAEVTNGSKSNIVGMNLFYFNPRDFKEGTIHEGFIGVVPEFEGKGIATAMRKHAIAHFRRSGLSGISTRISKNNNASLRSAEKLGFRPVEEYFDPAMQEDRYYLVCNFENNCDQ